MRPTHLSNLALTGLLLAAILPGCSETAPPPTPPSVSALGRLLPAVEEDLNRGTTKVVQNPTNWVLWGTLGIRYEVHSAYAPALECYKVAAENLPGNAQWPYRAAIAAARTDNPQLALDWIERSLKIDSQYPTSHYRRGNWLLELGRLDEAAKAFQKAADLGPKQSETWAGLARVALQDDDPQHALSQIKKARKLSPSDPYLHLLLGITLSQLGRESEAESHLALGQGSAPAVTDPWSRVVSMGRTRERDLLKRAKTLEAKGDFSGAIRAYRKIMEARPDEIKLPLSLARTLVQAKRLEEAKQLIDDTLAKYPTHLELLLFQGALLKKQGDPEGAMSACHKALISSPDRPDAHIFHSTLLSLKGDHEGALAAAKKAVDLAPFESRGYEVLAQRYSAMKRPWDAVRILESALDQEGFKPSVRIYQMTMQGLKALKRTDKIPAILKRAQADHGTKAFPN